MADSSAPRSSRLWGLVEHPRPSFIAALVLAGVGVFSPRDLAYLLWMIAAALVVLSAWEWQPLRRRIPFSFRSPVIRSTAVAKVQPPTAELGSVDYELYTERAFAATNRALDKMAEEVARHGRRLPRETARLEKMQGKSAEQRHRALVQNGRVISKHARRLSRLEMVYRNEVSVLVTNGRKVMEHAGPNAEVAASFRGWREATIQSRDVSLDYRATAQTQRQQSVSQAINAASDELVAVMTRVIEDSETVIDYCDWCIKILEG